VTSKGYRRSSAYVARGAVRKGIKRTGKQRMICAGSMRIIAFIEQPAVIGKVLIHLGLGDLRTQSTAGVPVAVFPATGRPRRVMSSPHGWCIRSVFVPGVGVRPAAPAQPPSCPQVALDIRSQAPDISAHRSRRSSGLRNRPCRWPRAVAEREFVERAPKANSFHLLSPPATSQEGEGNRWITGSV